MQLIHVIYFRCIVIIITMVFILCCHTVDILLLCVKLQLGKIRKNLKIYVEIIMIFC